MAVAVARNLETLKSLPGNPRRVHWAADASAGNIVLGTPPHEVTFEACEKSTAYCDTELEVRQSLCPFLQDGEEGKLRARRRRRASGRRRRRTDCDHADSKNCDMCVTGYGCKTSGCQTEAGVTTCEVGESA